MFGRRSADTPTSTAVRPAAPPAPAASASAQRSPQAAPAAAPRAPEPPTPEPRGQKSEEYYDVKTTLFNALIDTIDLTQLAKLDSAPMREQLEATFADNADDYGRKLYLIENCLYGVDIQPIAIQITKLRFFISLVCDQRTNRSKKENHGIRPLPNLETKVVAADVLIGLEMEIGRAHV